MCFKNLYILMEISHTSVASLAMKLSLKPFEVEQKLKGKIEWNLKEIQIIHELFQPYYLDLVLQQSAG